MIRKTGILGGTFDPVHNGHIALAKTAKEVCSLDDVLLLPAPLPPHKRDVLLSSYADRVAMLEIAVADHDDLSVSTLEQLLPTPSYTIDTLQYLKLHSPDSVELYFLCGSDTFLDIRSWKEYEHVLAGCNFIVFSREGESTARLVALFDTLGFTKKNKVCWQHGTSAKKVYHIDTNLPAVSSSAIRKQVAQSHSVEHLLPAKVAAYIQKKCLYS